MHWRVYVCITVNVWVPSMRVVVNRGHILMYSCEPLARVPV